MQKLAHRTLIAWSLLVCVAGACERPQDRPLDPELPAPTPPEPTNDGSPDADTGRTLGPIAEMPAAGTTGLGGAVGTGGTATAGIPGTGGRSIH
jgi:hypothetical protein